MAQVNRLVRNYTGLQSETRPFDRFRFAPTHEDRQRVERLRQGRVDTVRVLCLRVEFVEDTTSLTTGNGKMDTLGFLAPDSGLFYDPPHFKRYFERTMEGVRSYFLAQSLGRLYVEYKIMPEGEKDAYQLPRQMQFYGDTISWQAVEVGLVRLMRDAFKIADEDPAIRFGDHDEFIVFHAGSGLQADFGMRRDSPFDLLAGEIPAGAIEAYLGESYISVDSGRTRIEQATVMPEMMRQDTMYNGETNILGMVGLAGTLCHEFCHLLGAYDLYDVTGVTMGVGAWSLMGYGGWLGDYGAGAPPGVIPGFLDAYHRVQLGFVTPLVVRTPRDSISVYAAEMDTARFHERADTARPTVLKVPATLNEYFLVENRQVDARKTDTIVVDVEDGVLIGIEDNEYDFLQVGSGILIWHVDEAVIADYGPFNAINIDPAHKGVDMEEGDGVQDFDVPYWLSWDPDYEIYGSPFDPFYRGGYNDRFTAETHPSSDGYLGKSFLSVTLLGEKTDSTNRLKDTVIPVSVDWELYQKGFPVQYGDSPLLSPVAADVDRDDTLEVAVLDTAGLLSVLRHDGRRLRTIGSGSPTRAAVALGDVVGDSWLEAVVAGNDGGVRVIPLAAGVPVVMHGGDRFTAAPVLVDFDADGKKEIVAGCTDMRLYAWRGTGEALPGFPVYLGTELRAPVAVTDTVRPELVVLGSDGRLFVLNPYGGILDGFPVVLSDVAYYNAAQPLVGDFDRDGRAEIAVIAGGDYNNRLYLVSMDGTLEHGSRELVRQPFHGTPAAADVNGDGYPDLLAASMNELFAFSHNAALAAGYPFKQDSTYETSELAGNWIIFYDVYFQYLSSPVAADLDGDGTTDIAIGSPRYGVLGFDGTDGSPLRFFPLMATASVSSVPLVADLDLDGDVELVAGADDGILHVWDLPGPASGIRWGCAYHDPCHTGLLPDSELPIMPEPEDKLIGNYFVYPNPAGDFPSIPDHLRNVAIVRYELGPAESETEISVFDMAGDPVDVEVRKVRERPNQPCESELTLEKVDPGLYIVRLQVRAGERSAVKLAKLAVVK